jgi:hypothetical protein
VRQVQKERLLFVVLDEPDGALREQRGELGLVGIQLGHRVAFDQRQFGKEVLPLRVSRPHVVRVRQAEVFVEPVPERQERLFVPEMPFAEDRRCIPALLQDLRDRELVRV